MSKTTRGTNITTAATARAQPATASTAARTVAKPLAVTQTINRQRIPATVDFLGQQGSTLTTELQPFRTAALSKVYLGLGQIQTSLKAITAALTGPAVPANLVGALHQPDGSAAAQVQITFDPTSLGGKPPAVTILTNDSGGFTLPMPSGVVMPASGITLSVHGANNNTTVTIAPAQIAANGLVGILTLPVTTNPLPVSILAGLQALLPSQLPDPSAPPPANPPQLPSVHLGEDGVCSQEFNASATIDSFPFGVFVRLIEPQLSIVNEVLRVPIGEGKNFFPLPIYLNGVSLTGNASTITSYADRVPVEQPLSVDGFRDQIMGVDATGTFGADETVPMAATLGLGYVLEMQQQWTFAGVALGDLVYSLPLAPGEQQQIAVFERTDTASVTESEFFTESQEAEQTALADTSTAATFNSAFSEAMNAGSSFQSNSSNWGVGGSVIIFSAGGGGSSSSGSSQEWLQGQRDTVQNAAQQTHSSATNQAAARRSAARTGMRLASASESESVTTQTITNHNHAHALTMQYWEVVRDYNVTTVIDGLTFACLVPMQIVRFMPPGQTLTLSDTTSVSSRAQVLARYAALIKHLDVLQQAVPRAYQYGLTLLAQFAGDPTATVEAAGGVAEDVIAFTLTGNFLPCETIAVRAVTRRNTRVGPVVLANTAPQIPVDKFASQDDLLAYLLGQRQAPVSTPSFSGNLALPQSMNRADVVGFEIIRNFNQVTYTLISPEMALLGALQSLFGGGGASLDTAIQSTLGGDAAANARITITLRPTDLEAALGGPMLGYFSASIVEYNASGNTVPGPANETYANDPLFGVELPPQPYPVPALQIAPVLRFHEILEIEKAMHHIVRNTTLYSKAVWSSLSQDERAILLDAYTIGVPSNGVSDASQMVPLLNCVENRLLGFFGNSMILPFIIPQSVADSMGLDPAEIQQVLLAYQQASFVPPTATLSLPTRGVLGEAVLGHCPSAEKIDLTRFWNWQDSPADTAPTISPVTLPTTTPSIAAGLTAPNSLTNTPSLINNVLTAPTPSTSLLQSLGQNAASQKDFSDALTGAQQLASLIQNTSTTASAARADAFNTTKALTTQAISTLGSIVTGKGSGSASGGKGKGGASGSGSGTSGSSSGSSSSSSSALSAALPILLALM
jgi:uncharacterized membrane protein YgcG